jgi:hypothetical protein
VNIKAAKFVQNLRGLLPQEKAVALNMAVHASFKECEADMSMTTLAHESGLKNRETASRIVKKLETVYGIIQAVGNHSGGRTSTTYVFTFAYDRDSGITVDGASNRDSGITVEKSESAANRDFDAGPTVIRQHPNRDSAALQP